MRPITLALSVAFVTPFWSTLAYIVGGWGFAGWALIFLGLIEIGIALLATVSKGPPRYRIYEEQRVGELLPNGHLRLALAERRALVKWQAEQRRKVAA